MGECEPGADVPRGTKVVPSCHLGRGYLAAHPCRRRGLWRARDRCPRDRPADESLGQRIPRLALVDLPTLTLRLAQVRRAWIEPDA